MSSSADSPLRKCVGVANGNRVIENAGATSNREPADAVMRMAAKLQIGEGK